MSSNTKERWNDVENGTWKVKKIQCKKCTFYERNPMACTKFPKGKPNEILKSTKECEFYQEM